MPLSNSNLTSGGLLSKITRGHIDKMLPKCPLCGSRSPLWTTHYNALSARIQFRCNDCDSVFSITQTDFLGVYKLHNSNLFVRLYTFPLLLLESLRKILHRQKISKPYVRIDEYGFIDDFPFKKGKSVALDELQQIADTFP